MKLKTPTVVNNLPSTSRMHWLLLKSSTPTEDLLKTSLDFLITSAGMTREKAKEMLGLV